MTEVLAIVNSYYSTWDEEAIEAGDTDDKGEHEIRTYDASDFDTEEGETLADAVAEYLYDKGAWSPSNGGEWQKSTWYSTTDDEIDFRTGERTQYSFHLEGVTDEVAKEIHDKLMAKVKG